MLSGLFSGLTLGLMGLDVIGLQIVQKGENKELARQESLVDPRIFICFPRFSKDFPRILLENPSSWLGRYTF